MAGPSQGAGLNFNMGKQPVNLKFKLPDPSAKFGSFVQTIKENRKAKHKRRPPVVTVNTARKALQLGLVEEDHFETARALAYYEQVVKMDPTNVDGLLRCSKALSDLTLEPGTSPAQAQALVQRAVDLAQEAMRLNDKDARTHLAVAINLARLALYTDNQTKVQYVRQVRVEAQTAYALDPNEDYAYHILGRWHNELASVPWWIKVAIDLFYGGTGETGSHHTAKEMFEKCIELNPQRMVHHIEMGRTHLKMGEHEKALESLTRSQALPVEDINALHEKFDAGEMIKGLQNGDRNIDTGWRDVPHSWVAKHLPLEQKRKFPSEY